VNLLRYGDTAVLVEPDDGVDPIGLRAALLAAPLPGTVSVVSAARTVLIEFDPAAVSLDALAAYLDSLLVEAMPAPAGALVEIPVRYDGADLADVAAATGLAVDEVVRRHSAASYRVAFCGFAPGFAYLEGLDPALHVSRLREPRTAVPAGAVAIAGGFTAVYPRSSPGGWRLLGTSTAGLWQADRDPPALLTPGTTVRFVAT
jgi:KipI family sensor histidine kinase inhibitor